MKVHAVENSLSLKIIWLLMLILASISSSENTHCPFQHLYHFGDGYTDIGNSIHVRPQFPNPASQSPYGITNPGWPTGRWCDGLTDFDFAAIDFGLPNIVPYLKWNSSTSNDGVIFSVARSPVLDTTFFNSRGINIPPYVVPLRHQMRWFKTYLQSVCQTPKDCADLLGNSLVLMGDIEGNDIGYALTQGKSIAEIKTYVPLIVETIINASRELVELGATRLIIPGNGPLGCYPYILTALQTNDSTAYDHLLCLKSVNSLIIWKNNILQQAMENLANEFPDVFITYGNIYDGLRPVIAAATVIGPDGSNKALKSCCGIGGQYNYDSTRFCGSQEVPYCSDPSEYIFWDGINLTQEAYYRAEQLLVWDALDVLNCTYQFTASI